MPKEIYCAKCGKVLRQGRQAAKGKVIHVVFPHTCGELNESLINELAESPDFKPVESDEENEFVQKLNDLKPDSALRDRRPDEHVKKETTYSTAPASIQDRFSLGPKIKPDAAGEGQTVPDIDEVNDG